MFTILFIFEQKKTVQTYLLPPHPKDGLSWGGGGFYSMMHWVHGPKYGTVQLSTTHKVRSLTDPTEGVANSYSRLNRPIMYVPIRYLRHCNL